MKDYLLNCDDSRRNILSYKIKNGEIVAKLASGELYTIPYSDENENTIISRMEEQARKSQITPLKKTEKIFPLLLPFIIFPLSTITAAPLSTILEKYCQGISPQHKYTA